MNSGSPANPSGSLKKRFGYKLVTNLVGLALGILFAGLVPRAMGPKSYGDYNYLINFFNQWIGFLDMRSSTWLYTRLSTSHRDRKAMGIYLWLAAFLSLATIGLSAVALSLGLGETVWPGQGAKVVLLSALLGLLFWYSDLFAKVCDAIGLTIRLEKLRIASRLAFFVALFAMVKAGMMGLVPYFLYQMTTTALLVALMLVILFRAGFFSGMSLHPGKIGAWGGIRSILAYSHPVLVYSLLGVLSNYLDRWLLQRFGGSAEQGFFSFALNISLVFNVFINAIHPLVMREFSIAFAENDTRRVADLFNKMVPSIYALTAVVSCFIIANASECVDFIGGAAFGDAKGPFLIMSFLPVIHNYSILSGSVLWASDNTRLIRNLGIILAPIGLAATWFILGPSEYGGFHLGSLGLAYKTVGLEFLGVNLVLWCNSRIIPLNFWKLFFHQIYSVAGLVALAIASKAIVGTIPAVNSAAPLMRLAVSGTIYIALVAGLFWYVPAVLGISKNDFLELARQLRKKFTAPSLRTPES